MIQCDYLTHIQYSFAMVDPSTNKITFFDKHTAIGEDFKDMNITHKGKLLELSKTLQIHVFISLDNMALFD